MNMAKKKTTTRKTTKKTTRTTAKAKPVAAKRKGILDIAAEMLARSKKPMGAKEIVERALDKGLWQTSGKTPSATLYAAMIREIAAKGKDARCQKGERGPCTSNGARE